MNKLMFLTIIFVVILKAEVKIFDINDYAIDLEHNKIEHFNEELIYKHEYQDSIRISILTELLEYENNKFPLSIQIDSMDLVFINEIKGHSDLNYTKNISKYNNRPVKLGGNGTIRHKNYAVLESFPFLFINDSLFFTPRVEYTYLDTIILNKKLEKVSMEIDMVIITSDTLSSYFKEFIEYKKKLGLNTVLKDIESIYSEYQGESNIEKIRNYINQMYISHNLKYVILGGDYSIVPVGYAKYTDGSLIPTDTFYSNLDGGLDDNENGVNGEYFDYLDNYADVFVGRFPGSNGYEISSIINKTINYYTGNVSQNIDLYSSFFLAGFNVFTDYDGQLWCERVGEEIPENFSEYKFYEENNPDFNQQNLINHYNTGYNIIYQQSHGDYNKVGQNENEWALWSDHFYNLYGLSGLYLIASCHPGDISYSGLSQKAMINPNGGCVNYLGSSTTDYPHASIGMNSCFFNYSFRNNNIGKSLVYANLISYGNLRNSPVGWKLAHSYNIQGDPSNKLFLGEPRNISILGINQFKKGSGTVNGVFNMVPNETVEITLVSNGEIVSKTSTDIQSFTLEYENLFSDSVYMYYHSQECYLKERGYVVGNNDSVEIQVSDIAINDSNNSGIAEFVDNLSIGFNLNVSLNSSEDDSLKVYIVENSDTDLDLLIDSIKIGLPAIGITTPFSIFDIVYNPSTRAKQDSSAQVTMYFEHNNVIINQEELYIPVADPIINLQSLVYSEDKIYPTFTNPSQGTIDKVEISLVEIIKEEYTQVKGTKTLFDITGLSTVNDDTLSFFVDSTKTYKFQIIINDDYVYNTSEFTSSNISGSLKLYTDYSPGKVNLEWANDLAGTFEYNVYVDTNSDFQNPELINFEPLNGVKYSFNNNQSSTIYCRVAVLDTNNVEVLYSTINKIDFIPLYKEKEFKLNQYEMYNPMFIDNKLIANLINSSVSGIHKDGSLINGTGIIHESEIQGFSTSLQQGYAIGDVNGDGSNDIINYLRNVGDSVQVKVVDLTNGNKIASKKVYGYFMETAPVLVQFDEDPEMEIMVSCFNGNIAGDPKGAYIYMLDYNNGSLDMVPGFPIISAYGQYYVHSPSLLDLDNNGVDEIIVDCYNKIEIYNSSTQSSITTFGLSVGIQTSLSYCDLNEDGQIEIFAVTESTGTKGKLYGYNFNGTTLVEIPEIFGGISLDMKSSSFLDLLPPVSFADLDDDSTVDIIALTASKLYIYDNQFNLRANFPVDLDSRILVNNLSAPSFGDFDGDTILDILFMDANFRVWCYSGASGALLEGFPIQIEDIDRIEMTALPIMDLDGDNDLEFAIGTNNGVMLVYDYPTPTTRLDTYDKYRGDQFNSGLFGTILGAPENITTVQNGTDLDISWDPVATATSYMIYVSDDPYAGFIELDETSNTNYTVLNITDSKKFYYIIAVK